MKLKVFNAETASGIRMTGPVVNIHRSGVMRFNRSAAALLGLTDKSKIALVQDENEKCDWYINATAKKDGFPIRPDKNGGGIMYCNNAVVAKSILTSYAKEDEHPPRSVTFPIAPKPEKQEGMELWALLLAGSKVREKNEE